MDNSISRTGFHTEALHLPALSQGVGRGTRFFVYASLPNGCGVLIGVAATQQNAAALTRLVAPGNGIDTLIIAEAQVPFALVEALSNSSRARARKPQQLRFARRAARRKASEKNLSQSLESLAQLGA